MVSVVPANMAAGLTTDEIIGSYPPLSPQDVQAANSYAVALGRQRLVALPEAVFPRGIDPFQNFDLSKKSEF
jgi:hypothetical protein